MAISPPPATWTIGETDSTVDDSFPLIESASSGQFVSRDAGVSFPRETLSTALAAIVASTKGLDPTDEGFRLYEHLEPDALDSLYDHAQRRDGANWQLEFHVGADTVRVDSDGGIDVARDS